MNKILKFSYFSIQGYDCTIVTPDKNSDEKMSTMSLLGSDIVQTPAMAHYHDPENFVAVTNRLLQHYPNGVSMDQVNIYECFYTYT